ncbi:MAG: hypothetical protein ACTHXA_07210 [Gulosibacter sp.]|uniref:hypothetical protein n=1 Tax=Gulosibacter sp. TaxID=2817531 RepID=UPI003F8E7048
MALFQKQGTGSEGEEFAKAVENVEKASPRRAWHIISAAGAGVTATTFLVLAFMFFVVFAQSQSSLEFLSYTLFMLQILGMVWALIVHTPLWLLVERRGWNKYLIMALEAIALGPVVAILLLATQLFTVETWGLFVALLFIPALFHAGVSGLALQNEKLRRRGWLIWVIATVVTFIAWFLSGILPWMLR